jgi:hypothetical protein
MNTDIRATKESIIKAGHKAVLELIKVAEEPIFSESDNNDVGTSKEDLAADKLKNAAASKKLAIFDAFEILNRINEEQKAIEEDAKSSNDETFKGFAERRSRIGG